MKRFFAVISVFLVVSLLLALGLSVPARADETIDTLFSWDRNYLSGTITDNNRTWTLDPSYIINYNSSYNVTIPSYSVSPISMQYITIDLTGFTRDARSDARFRISFDSSGDLSKYVVGGSFIVGIWIPGYKDSYEFEIDQIYFYGSGSGDTGFYTDYIGYSSIGCRCYKVSIRPDPNGNNSPLSAFQYMDINCHWTGKPSSGEFSLLLSNSSYLIIQDPDSSEIDYMRLQNEVMEQKSQDVLDDLSLTPPDVDDIIGDLDGDFAVIASEASWLFEPPYGNRLYSFLVSCGAASLSIAFLGYILYGKKG